MPMTSMRRDRRTDAAVSCTPLPVTAKADGSLAASRSSETPLRLLPRRACASGCSITEVAKTLALTPRALRHYEQVGLVQPLRVGRDRRYDGAAIAKLRMIALLRRAAVPIRDIRQTYTLPEADQARTFEQMVKARLTALQRETELLNDELAALEVPLR